MSAHKPNISAAEKPKNFGWMAEYTDEHSLLNAARKVRDSGYTKTDAYTPFPVHGIDEALGIKPTVLPFIVLGMAFTGLFTAIAMQVWMNAIDYRYIISGKPFISGPAFVPVSFETTVLFSAFTTFLAMWGLNGLPRFSNPVFTSPRFDRATNDRFFLHVDSRDKYFNRESVKELLSGTHPESLEEVIEDSTPNKFPSIVWLGLTTLIVASFVPATIVANIRAGNSEKPRWHVWFDMDFQPKKKAQSTTTIFADGRSARPQVPGTVARDQLEQQDIFYLGYDPSKIASSSSPVGMKLVSAQEDAKAPSLEAPIEEDGKQGSENKATDKKPADDSEKVEKKAESKKKNAKKDAAKKDDAKKNDAKKEEPKKEDAKKEDAKKVTSKSDDSKKNDESKKEDSKKEDSKSKADAAKANADKPDTPATKPEANKPDAAKPDAKPTPATANAGAPAASNAGASAAGPNLPWVTEYPVEVTSEMLALGQKKFEIYCSVCHGYGGDGDGLVHRRADQLQQGYWLPPTSMHEQRIRDQAVGNIFYTISQGKGKMASYAAVLTPKERWAIVMYVRALQRSRNADIKDVPVDQRASIEEVKKAE